MTEPVEPGDLDMVLAGRDTIQEVMARVSGESGVEAKGLRFGCEYTSLPEFPDDDAFTLESAKAAALHALVQFRFVPCFESLLPDADRNASNNNGPNSWSAILTKVRETCTSHAQSVGIQNQPEWGTLFETLVSSATKRAIPRTIKNENPEEKKIRWLACIELRWLSTTFGIYKRLADRVLPVAEGEKPFRDFLERDWNGDEDAERRELAAILCGRVGIHNAWLPKFVDATESVNYGRCPVEILNHIANSTAGSREQAYRDLLYVINCPMAATIPEPGPPKRELKSVVRECDTLAADSFGLLLLGRKASGKTRLAVDIARTMADAYAVGNTQNLNQMLANTVHEVCLDRSVDDKRKIVDFDGFTDADATRIVAKELCGEDFAQIGLPIIFWVLLALSVIGFIAGLCCFSTSPGLFPWACWIGVVSLVAALLVICAAVLSYRINVHGKISELEKRANRSLPFGPRLLGQKRLPAIFRIASRRVPPNVSDVCFLPQHTHRHERRSGGGGHVYHKQIRESTLPFVQNFSFAGVGDERRLKGLYVLDTRGEMLAVPRGDAKEGVRVGAFGGHPNLFHGIIIAESLENEFGVDAKNEMMSAIEFLEGLLRGGHWPPQPLMIVLTHADTVPEDPRWRPDDATFLLESDRAGITNLVGRDGLLDAANVVQDRGNNEAIEAFNTLITNAGNGVIFSGELAYRIALVTKHLAQIIRAWPFDVQILLTGADSETHGLAKTRELLEWFFMDLQAPSDQAALYHEFVNTYYRGGDGDAI